MKDMTQWKKNVEQSLRCQRPKIILNGPVYVAMTFYIYPPQSISKIKTKRPRTNKELEKTFVDKRPDIDNYVKAVLDASNDILFKDDGQIAVMSVQKLYSLNPRIEILIDKLEAEK